MILVEMCAIIMKHCASDWKVIVISSQLEVKKHIIVGFLFVTAFIILIMSAPKRKCERQVFYCFGELDCGGELKMCEDRALRLGGGVGMCQGGVLSNMCSSWFIFSPAGATKLVSGTRWRQSKINLASDVCFVLNFIDFSQMQLWLWIYMLLVWWMLTTLNEAHTMQI